MAKKTSQKIQEIDTNFKSEMRMLNNSTGNILDNTYCVVMEPSSLLRSASFFVPNRSTEHRVLFLKKGTMRVSVNFEEYSMVEGDMIVVPARHILSIEHVSHGAEPWFIAFKFDVPEEQSLVGIEATQVSPEFNDIRMAEDYFRLMRDALARPIPNRDDFKHLVLSLLYRMQKIYSAKTGRNPGDIGPRAKQIKVEFINLVVTVEPPVRQISFYATRLNVSPNYLSIIIKQETARTVMSWIEDKLNSMIKMMLASPEGFTLEQITDRCGYSTGNQVSRLFKKLNDITPLEYRRLVWENPGVQMV